jgi:hypothetical protein
MTSELILRISISLYVLIGIAYAIKEHISPDQVDQESTRREREAVLREYRRLLAECEEIYPSSAAARLEIAARISSLEREREIEEEQRAAVGEVSDKSLWKIAFVVHAVFWLPLLLMQWFYYMRVIGLRVKLLVLQLRKMERR